LGRVDSRALARVLGFDRRPSLALSGELLEGDVALLVRLAHDVVRFIDFRFERLLKLCHLASVQTIAFLECGSAGARVLGQPRGSLRPFVIAVPAHFGERSRMRGHLGSSRLSLFKHGGFSGANAGLEFVGLGALRRLILARFAESLLKRCDARLLFGTPGRCLFRVRASQRERRLVCLRERIALIVRSPLRRHF
jgi:hypothetical protein